MNGNFEVDKGQYPYGVVRRGDRHIVTNLPTLAEVCSHDLPVQVAQELALRLNTIYYRGNYGNPREIPQDRVTALELATQDDCRAVLLTVLADLYELGLLDGAVYSQLKQRVQGF